MNESEVGLSSPGAKPWFWFFRSEEPGMVFYKKGRGFLICAAPPPRFPLSRVPDNARSSKTTGFSKFQRIQFLETGNSHARNSPVKFQKFRLFFEFRYHFSYDCGCFFIFLRHEGVGISFGSMVGIGYLDSATWGVKSKNSF